MLRAALSLLAVASLVLVNAESEDDVLVVGSDNYKDVIKNPYVLMEFYAPWCGHCKALAPEYAKAAKQLKEEGSDVILAKVDATEEGELAKEHGVRGYPTIKFFKNGKPMEYGGGRTAKDIVQWLKKRTGPPAVTLDSVDACKKFIDSNEVAVIGYFEDENSDKATTYINTADADDSLSYGIVTSKEVTEGMEATVDSVVVYKKFDNGRAVYDGSWTTEDLLTFIAGEQLPLVTKFSDETAPKIFGGKLKTHLLAFFPGEDEKLLETLKTAAADFKGKMLFVQIDTDDEASERVVEYFGIEDSNLPTCRIINLEEDMQKFVPPFEGINAEELKKWVASYLDGNLKAHLNTEDVPEDWDAEPVKVLVGKNFDEVTSDKTRNVFVEFYAPWCGHCKQLAPIWDKLGKHFKDNEEIMIAKMDSTKNEVESIRVEGFPTLKMITKDNEVLDYNGGRTFNDLKKYVEDILAGKKPEADIVDEGDDMMDDMEGMEGMEDDGEDTTDDTDGDDAPKDEL